MRLLFDFLPIVVFFITYKLFGIYVATAAAIFISLFQVISYWIKHRTLLSIQLISLILILLFGGGTLLFHNELFIKWKPTALYWVLACFTLVTQYVGKKPLIQHLLETNISLPPPLWFSLNRNWVIFFVVMGGINLWVAYAFNTNTWVNFKLFGFLGITFLFVLAQAIYLSRFIRSEEIKKPNSVISLGSAEVIRTKLSQGLAPTTLEILDEGPQHHGHAAEGAGHFLVRISSPLFKNKSLIECHKLVYAALGNMVGTTIHALRIEILKKNIEH